MITLVSIAVVVVLAACGFGSYLLVRDDRQLVGALPDPSPSIATRDISSRAVDPTPMTVADVFPAVEIHADPTVPPYQMVGTAQQAKDCRAGATDELGRLLVRLGCNQLIRGTFKSPDGAHWVTAGVFNLKDGAATEQAHQQIMELVNAGRGRFTGYVSAPATRVLGRAPTQLAWDEQGHFLIYCVIARVDGKEFPEGDPHLRVIVYDMVEKYLRGNVIATWAIDRGTPGPGASGPATAGPAGSTPAAG